MGRNMEIGTSVVRRWQLAASLKALREGADLTQEAAIERLEPLPGRWSRSKLSRIENREHNIKPREVEQLLDVYGVTDTRLRDGLVALAASSSERGWWISFVDALPRDIQPLLSIEDSLVELWSFQPQLVNGLLQTAEYARAVMLAAAPGECSPEELERKVAARMIRQHVLQRQPAPKAHFIYDEAVLDHVIGDEEVMRGQLRKLLSVAESPNISIQVLRRDVGGSPGLEGPFSILTLPAPMPDIGYTEGPAGMFYIEDREHVRAWTLRFGILTELALSRAESRDLIAEAAKLYA
ncbi:helix-turn-helix domain-containing protein [Streptomyces sp. NPDC087851]|uniref:helix-turn-helix domain-containing protein n=1 Tax=Streptomyces sp. NPDC087851 TaxID=3365810 RepID=UPI003811FEA2